MTPEQRARRVERIMARAMREIVEVLEDQERPRRRPRRVTAREGTPETEAISSRLCAGIRRTG